MENSVLINNQEDIEFNQIKQSLQEILDKHLPPEKRFSVKDFDKEDVGHMCRLLLEKDDKKRDLIWKELDEKRKNTMEQFEFDLSEIEKKKSEFYNYLEVSNGLSGLVDDIVNDKKFDEELDEF